jgi:hypothetical protein
MIARADPKSAKYVVWCMGKTSRAEQCRKHALDAETKAFNARTEETRRAWLIIAREWTKMADRAEASSPQRKEFPFAGRSFSLL